MHDSEIEKRERYPHVCITTLLFVGRGQANDRTVSEGKGIYYTVRVIKALALTLHGHFFLIGELIESIYYILTLLSQLSRNQNCPQPFLLLRKAKTI